jgi:hypothetical protein
LGSPQQLHSAKPQARSDALTWNLSTLDSLAQRALCHVEHHRGALDVDELVLEDLADLVVNRVACASASS